MQAGCYLIKADDRPLPVGLADRLRGTGLLVRTAELSRDPMTIAGSWLPDAVVVVANELVAEIDWALPAIRQAPFARHAVTGIVVPEATSPAETRSGVDFVCRWRGELHALTLYGALRKALYDRTPRIACADPVVDGLEFDDHARAVTAPDRRCTTTFTRREFELLSYLARRAGIAYSREALCAALSRTDVQPNPRAVDARIMRLRKSLNAIGADRRLKTVRGHGYLFSATAGVRDRDGRVAASMRSGPRAAMSA